LGIRLHYQGNTPDTSLFAFAEHLRKTLRSTDVLTRLHQQFIWILLPKTEQQGLNVVVDKINEFAHQEAVAKFIQIKLVPFCSEQLTELPDNVELLLAKLTASLP
jgi:GGDEF domain-containing protein